MHPSPGFPSRSRRSVIASSAGPTSRRQIGTRVSGLGPREASLATLSARFKRLDEPNVEVG